MRRLDDNDEDVGLRSHASAARWLDISVRHLRLLIEQGEIATVRIGERVTKIPQDSLDDFVRNRREIRK